MKYSFDESFAEVRRRGDVLKKKNEQRKVGAMSVATLCLAVLFFIAVLKCSGSPAMATEGNVYASFLMGSEAGAYVLVGIIAFLLGAVVTLICYKNRNKKTIEKRGTEK